MINRLYRKNLLLQERAVSVCDSKVFSRLTPPFRPWKGLCGAHFQRIEVRNGNDEPK